jgi:hypothetical protein
MKRLFVMGLSLAVVSLMFSSGAMAQLGSKKTIFTINQPMEIPGKPAIVLAPGKYVIKLLDTASSRTIVQFFNADETKLYATVIGIPDYRLTPPEKAEISFYEAEPGRAHPIRAWFYPGDNYGVEFVYPKARALEVAKASGQHVMSAANPTTSNPSEQPTAAQVAELKNEPVTAATPQGTEISLAEVHPATTPAPSSTATAAVKPESKPATEAATSEPAKIAANTSTPTPASQTPAASGKTLPKTASNLPLLALAGITLTGAAFSLRILAS